MKYYVMSDIHGFYTEMEKALIEKGFYTDSEPHKLIICGDLLDRGLEAVKTQDFALEHLHKGDLIFIRGNHEDLMVDMVSNFEDCEKDIFHEHSHFCSNGTYSSALQLSDMNEFTARHSPEEFIEKARLTPFYKELIPASVDYYETENYIFVHGWIPCISDNLPAWYGKDKHYDYNPDWRNAGKEEWDIARWFNGMEMAELRDVVERGKQIVCGHWHTSYAHCWLEKKCSEFGDDADFTPYYSKNIIAIDSCVAHSGFLNCIVLED